jgi:ATP-binding cassette subfamily F protein 3
MARDEYNLQRHAAQQEFIRNETDYIQKNIAGQNTRQAQDRRKRLRRMMATELIDLPTAKRTAKIEFEETARSGDIVLRTSDLEIGVPNDEDILFTAPDLELRRGARVALIGPNGAGKTTFLKALLGDQPPRSGSIRLGASLQIGYLEQAHANLNPDHDLLQAIDIYFGTPSNQAMRDYLARFAFVQDDVFKKVKDLSGGERSRLALAILILQGANFLLLDEPTNHLDIPSQEVLEEALAAFAGTILLVSHDRYLIDSLADQLWVISPEARQLSVYPAGYDAYRVAVEAQEGSRKQNKVSSERRRSDRKGRGGSAWELQSLEERIEKLEAELAKVSAELDVGGGDVDELIRLGERYAEIENLLSVSYARWESIARDTSSA